ncbi:hypothetical protein GN958_ATG04128, partial [Phytophthora infestans]
PQGHIKHTLVGSELPLAGLSPLNTVKRTINLTGAARSTSTASQRSTLKRFYRDKHTKLDIKVALKDLYRRKQISLPAAYENKMLTYFFRLKRLQASAYQAMSDKDPLPYRTFCSPTLMRLDVESYVPIRIRSNHLHEHLSAHDDCVGSVMHKSKE